MFKKTWLIPALIVFAVPVRADIIVNVQNTSIAAGGTGFVDVLVSSSGGDLLLSEFNYDFEITGDILNGDLQFQAIQIPNDQSVFAPPDDYNYVLGTDTDPGNFSANRQDPVLTRLTGGDFTLSGGDVTLSSVPTLLARLEIEHITATPLDAVGDTFSLMLKDTAATSFKSADSTPLPIDSFSFSHSGTITITGAAAVPEPGTFVTLSILAAAYGGRCLRRRKVVLR